MIGEVRGAQSKVEASARHGRAARRWRAIVFAPSGDGATRRRASDAVRLGLSLLAIVVGTIVIRASSSAELRVESLFHAPPDGIRWLVTTVWYVGSLGVIVGLILVALIAHNAPLARNAALAGAFSWLVCGICGWLFGATGGRQVAESLQDVNAGYPLARIAATMAVACVALPYLNRGFRRLVMVLVAVASVATVVNGSGFPVNVLFSLALGWGIAAAVHLIFGSPVGLPSALEVGDSLADIGMDVDGLTVEPDQLWGVVRLTGTGEGGRPLSVTVYGRDAANAQLLAKLWRFLVYRDSGPTLQLSRLQQVEHEAYLTLMAEHVGITAPAIVASGMGGPRRDAILVTAPPPGRPLAELEADQVTDASLDAILAMVLRLRGPAVAHGAVSHRTIVLDEDGQPGLCDFRCSSSGAPSSRLDHDLAGALVACALVVGTERTAAAANRVIGAELLPDVVLSLQPAGLDPVLTKALRSNKEANKELLANLRAQCAAEAGFEVPKLPELKRISVTNLVLILGSIIGIWALVGVLVDVSSSFSTLEGAAWGWVAVVFVLGQLPNLAKAWALTGAVPGVIPLGPATQLEVSNNFTALVAGTMGSLAMDIRFFQKRGYDATVAVSAGVLDSTVSWVVKGLLFVISLPFAISSLHFAQSNSENSGGETSLVWIILAVIVGLGVLVGIVLLIPKLRNLTVPKLRAVAVARIKPHAVDALNNLKTLARQPRKLVAVFGGNLGAQLFTAMALGAALHAFGERLPLTTIFVVITLASMVGGLSPVPGGMGVVEAGLIAGLAAAGIPQNIDVAAVFTQRLFTAYLSPIWGWFTLMWMRRRDYI